MITRPSPRALLPLSLAVLIAVPLAGAALVLRPVAQADASADEVRAFVAELGAALPPDRTDTRVLLRTTAQEDEDPDGDGLPTELEIRLGLDSEDPDTDGDGVEDGAEDSDGDGLRNLDELRTTRTDPGEKDTDGDGTSDGKEDPDRDGLTNRFEVNRTKTDPRQEDSDRDGLHDGIEDPDGDHLSNRGEQRFGTNPNRKDSDGDRRDDWHEDSNRNGVPDGREQDKGRLPSSLKPSLSRATKDVPPTHHKRCHSRGTETAARACSFGPKKARKLVILTGDSHAAHWLPALRKVAKHRGWKLMTITKSSCPVADVLVAPGDAKARACSTWRRKAWARIRSLNPNLVIASSLDSYAFRNGTSARSKSDSAWKAALNRSLKKLGRGRATVLMLGDVYPWGSQRAVLACLRTHTRDLSKCQKSRSASTASWVRRRDKVQAAAAKAAGARFRSTRHVVCPYDPCPLVVDRMLVTRDGGHLSATYSREIWRALDRMVPDL